MPLDLRNKLKLANLQAKQLLLDKYPHVNPYLLTDALDIKRLRSKSAKLLGAGVMASTLLLANPTDSSLLPSSDDLLNSLKVNHTGTIAPVIAPQKLFVDALSQFLPAKPRPLMREEEKSIEKVIQEVMKVPAKASLEGEHLNTTFGYIGAEQHLKRYPGDTMRDQLPNKDVDLGKEGMAPGLGAWGYFAKSKTELTDALVETEKWYAVVQTLYLPDWNSRHRYLKEWYKYRKVLIVNTNNGNAVVAAIADSGPAAWTGKQFGGSPEVMLHLGGARYKKGPVLMFFVDDPENKVKLGPVEYNKIDLPQWAFHQV